MLSVVSVPVVLYWDLSPVSKTDMFTMYSMMTPFCDSTEGGIQFIERGPGVYWNHGNVVWRSRRSYERERGKGGGNRKDWREKGGEGRGKDAGGREGGRKEGEE